MVFPTISYSSIPTEECLGCHDKFNKFKHGKVTCIQCHNDISSLPHEEKLKKRSCNDCHNHTVKEYEGSAHSKGRLSCKGCHDVHFIKKQKKGCLDCHGNVSHDSLPSKEKHLKEMDCLACHGKTISSETIVDISINKKASIYNEIVDSDKNGFLNRSEWDKLQTILQKEHKDKYRIKKLYTVTSSPHSVMQKPVTCNECHNEKGLFRSVKITIYGKTSSVFSSDPKIFIPELLFIDSFKQTIHGKKGVVCSDCHVSQERINDTTCITCHGELYGIYKDTAHSKNGAALCTDCHNPHNTKAYRELSVADRLSTCVRCHSGYIEKHKWLPNTVLHFNYLECSTCHSPDSTKSMVFNFALIENGKETPFQYSNFKSIFGNDINLIDIIDSDGDGNIFCKELASFFLNVRKKTKKDVTIKSSVIVTRVHHNYSEKNTKSGICKSCHSEDASFYESMFVSVPEKEKTVYIPVRGPVLSSFPTSVFIDMCLLGEGKIKTKDFYNILHTTGEKRFQTISDLGFKLIDLIGIALFLLILSGIVIHIILRILVKK